MGIHDFLMDEVFDTPLTKWGTNASLVWLIADYIQTHGAHLHMTSQQDPGASYPWTDSGFKFKSLSSVFSCVKMMNDSYSEYSPGRQWTIGRFTSAYGTQNNANWLSLSNDNTIPSDNLNFSINYSKGEMWIYGYVITDTSQLYLLNDFCTTAQSAGWLDAQ